MRTKLVLGIVTGLLTALPLWSWASPPISASINAKKVAFIRSFIRDIREPISVAVQRANFDCGVPNSGGCVCSTTTLLDSEAISSDMYLQNLAISDTCVITLTVKNSALQSATISGGLISTFSGVLSSVIQLRPDMWSTTVSNNALEYGWWHPIKSWVCYTNIDAAIKLPFKGADTTILTGDASVLSLYEEEPYLGNCIYDSTLGAG